MTAAQHTSLYFTTQHCRVRFAEELSFTALYGTEKPVSARHCTNYTLHQRVINIFEAQAKDIDFSQLRLIWSSNYILSHGLGLELAPGPVYQAAKGR